MSCSSIPLSPGQSEPFTVNTCGIKMPVYEHWYVRGSSTRVPGMYLV